MVNDLIMFFFSLALYSLYLSLYIYHSVSFISKWVSVDIFANRKNSFQNAFSHIEIRKKKKKKEEGKAHSF